MPLTGINHYLIVSKNLERSKDFYRKVLDMELAERPDFGVPGYWLKIGDDICVHLASRRPNKTRSFACQAMTFIRGARAGSRREEVDCFAARNALKRNAMHRIISIIGFALVATVAAAQVTVQEYPLPPRVGAHDVWADPAPDGPVWFSAQRSGQLGRLDPKSGKVDMIPLGAKSSPHGVIAGADGAPWLTDSGLNAIVRVDPKTRELKSWPLPEGTGYANLNTAIFDKAGIHWFTGQSGYYGRLDPKTGDMKVFEAPKGRGPYGIHATPDGNVYYASLAGSYIARLDGATGKATVIEPPTRDQGARRVWSDSKGIIWVAEWNSGQLSRYDPKSGAWAQWKAPGPSPKVYAVYADEKDMVWVSDWSAQVMHRFDPATQKFETFKSSTSTANVRQIHGRKGEVWTPESAADKLVVYRYR